MMVVHTSTEETFDLVLYACRAAQVGGAHHSLVFATRM
jgi:hypothetical protein